MFKKLPIEKHTLVAKAPCTDCGEKVAYKWTTHERIHYKCGFCGSNHTLGEPPHNEMCDAWRVENDAAIAPAPKAEAPKKQVEEGPAPKPEKTEEKIPYWRR